MKYLRDLPEEYEPLVAQVMVNAAHGGMLKSRFAKLHIEFGEETAREFDVWLASHGHAPCPAWWDNTDPDEVIRCVLPRGHRVDHETAYGDIWQEDV